MKKTQISNDADYVDVLAKSSGISLAELIKMVEYWRSLPHPTPTIIQQISMEGSKLRTLIKNVDEFKLYTAAYLKDTGDYKKGDTTLIIGLNAGKDWKYCDIRDIFFRASSTTGERAGKPICPPPTPCGIP